MSPPVRRPLVIANWKMNLTERGSVSLTDALLNQLEATDSGIEVALAPSFPCLRAVADRLSGSSVLLAAQHLFEEDTGPFTGEVSPRMLVELGVHFVLVGHSERRIHFGETDERIGRKVAAARRHGIVPILCVGETKTERELGRTLAVVQRQLRLGLAELAAASEDEIVVAYEPVWAIGTGEVATAAQVQEVHRLLRDQLAAVGRAASAARTRILYGGSVTAENAPGLLALSDVDGALVGGASLDAPSFVSITRAAK